MGHFSWLNLLQLTHVEFQHLQQNTTDANTTKYAMGVDFSWLDSCDCQPAGLNYLGNGADYAMTYGLMETTAIHDGYVRDWGESRRMFALPRSSYAGMQRTGASM